MPRAIEKVQAEFRQRARKRVVEAPEWGLQIHVWPATLEVMHELESAGESSAQVLAATLIHRACDEHGNPLFNKAEIDVLMKQAWLDTVTRIAGEINADINHTLQEDVPDLGEGSAETIQTSGSNSGSLGS